MKSDKSAPTFIDIVSVTAVYSTAAMHIPL